MVQGFYPQPTYQQQPQEEHYPEDLGVGAVPSRTDPEKGDLLDKIRPEEIVEIIRNKLMGKVEIGGTWVVQKHLQDRAITEVGAWDIANLMLGVSSQNVSLSNLKDTEIAMRARSIARTAQFMLLRNWKEYGIKGTDQFWFVHELVFSNTFITLKHPLNHGIINLLKGTIHEQRTYMASENAGKQGVFGRMKAGLFR